MIAHVFDTRPGQTLQNLLLFTLFGMNHSFFECVNVLFMKAGDLFEIQSWKKKKCPYKTNLRRFQAVETQVFVSFHAHLDKNKRWLWHPNAKDNFPPRPAHTTKTCQWIDELTLAPRVSPRCWRVRQKRENNVCATLISLSRVQSQSTSTIVMKWVASQRDNQREIKKKTSKISVFTAATSSRTTSFLRLGLSRNVRVVDTSVKSTGKREGGIKQGVLTECEAGTSMRYFCLVSR